MQVINLPSISLNSLAEFLVLILHLKLPDNSLFYEESQSLDLPRENLHLDFCFGDQRVVLVLQLEHTPIGSHLELLVPRLQLGILKDSSIQFDIQVLNLELEVLNSGIVELICLG